MAENLDVHSSHVQRDYVHGWLLSLLYTKSALANRLVLKGGNCLRKGYFENSRYSRDIDFTTSVGISDDELGRELNLIVSELENLTKIKFHTSKTIVRDKKRADSEKKISEAKLYFTDFYGRESKLVLGVRLDVTQFDKIYLPVQERSLIHPYSDAHLCNSMIRCVKLEEILATKMRCLLQRKHIADLFDLVYATVINPEIQINRQEIISTFFKITIFGSNPSIAKGLFVDLPLEVIGRFWAKYISCPNISWFDFSKAKNSFLKLIETLIPGHAEQKFDNTFFPSNLRNPILESAESHKLLRFVYSNVERLIEPYELAFKIRKDGVAKEYLYAFDTVGGSSGPGIKIFVPGKVQEVEVTDKDFVPRFDIETSKSGGAETVTRFTNNRTDSIRNTFGVKRPRKRTRKSTIFPQSSSWAIQYKVQCPYCGKIFKRKTMSTKLNKHKDKFGNPCYGRAGYIV